MRKIAKIAAVCAAFGLALFAAGCSNSSSTPYVPGGSGGSGGGGGGGGGPTAKTIDLSTLTEDTVIEDNTILTGTLGGCYKISIADGATVTLSGASINAEGAITGQDIAGLTCEGNATINLADGSVNTIRFMKKNSGSDGGAGIFVPANKTLTIKGNTGILNATGTGAGIGANPNVNGGNVVINGGVINASGSGAGIGGTEYVDFGNITITGGTVTARSTSSNSNAGIGSGSGKSCGNISITGGTVTATGRYGGAGIGSGGSSASCGAITIANTVTKVTATAGETSGTNSIGKGKNGACGTVTIGGTVYADGISESPYTYDPNPSTEPGPGPEATEPLTLEFIAAGKITFTNKPASLKYSLDGGATWRAASDSISVSAGDKVGLYANGTGTTSISNAFKISCDADCYVYGNVMSLEKSSGFSTLLTLEGHSSAFHSLFYENTHIKNHGTKALQLPATTLSQSCYANMFMGCTSLTKAPALPATTLVERCYNAMFSGCTALTSAPALEAQTLANYCYASMFYKCSSLKAAPNLPATELKDGCYAYMFQFCSDLTGAPSQLPATTLAKSCYQSMFSNCKKLVTAPSLRAATLVQDCYNCLFENCAALTSITCLATNISVTSGIKYWVSGVGSGGTFTCDSTMVDIWTAKIGDALGSGVPTGWTVTAQ